VEKGENEAISLFFQNQSDLFYRVALKYTKNSADAEDVLQSAFILIANKASQYKGLQTDEEKLLQSWCLSIVVHCALKKIKMESNRKRKESNYSNSKPFHEEENMSTSLDNEAIYQKVQNAIVQLPEKFRVPIHLKYIEGFELDAIALILKLNANTLRSNIKRGLEKLSEQLKEDNITLSSVGLIGLIESLPLEKAPISIKSIAAQNFSAANSSRHLLINAKAKSIFLSFKFYASLIATCFVVTAIAFYWNKLNIVSNSNVKKTEQIPSKVEVLSQEDTNLSLAFINEKDRNQAVLLGKWEWSSRYKAMVSAFDQWLILSIAIKPQQKPFLLEIIMEPNLMNGEKSINLNSEAHWVLNNNTLKHKRFYSNEKNLREDFYKTKQKVTRFYFYKNYICSFIGDRCYAVEEYMEEINGANVSFFSLNFMLQQISSKTLMAPPDELLKAIDNKINLTSVIVENTKIKETFPIDQ
jgi:RNA polymerase sigma-70 factor (ECF subfamily)